MKVYLDENLSPRIAELLRARGIDTVSAHDVRNTQIDDRAQLRYATGEDRAIVTCDVAGFVGLAMEAVAANMEHAGIVLVPSNFPAKEYAVIADRIERVVRQYPDGLRGAVVYLSRTKRG